MNEIAYPNYIFAIPEEKLLSYPLTVQDFVEILETNPDSYSQLSNIRKHLCRTIFSASRSNDILDRPKIVENREQYQLTHRGKLPKRNLCLTIYNTLTCSKNVDRFDYEISASKRVVATRMLLDYIRIIYSEQSNSTANRTTSTLIGRSLTHGNSSNIGRYRQSTCSDANDRNALNNNNNNNGSNANGGKEIRTNSNSITALSPLIKAKTSLQVPHNTNQALLYTHSGSVPSSDKNNNGMKRRRSTSNKTQIAGFGIARRTKEYENSMALETPLDLLRGGNASDQLLTVGNNTEDTTPETNMNPHYMETTPPILEEEESNKALLNSK